MGKHKCQQNLKVQLNFSTHKKASALLHLTMVVKSFLYTQATLSEILAPFMKGRKWNMLKDLDVEDLKLQKLHSCKLSFILK